MNIKLIHYSNHFNLKENVIKFCFNEVKKNFIFMSDNETDDFFVLRLLHPSMTPMYMFETNKNAIFQTHKRYRNYSLNEEHLAKKNDPVTTAVIFASSNDILTMILQDLRDSVWWNHEAFFLIINKNSDNSCRLARLFLSTTWAFNILSATYICHDSDSQLILYTFNPYTSLAPKFWNEIRTDNVSNKYWTLFEHQVESVRSFETLLARSKCIEINV